MRFNKSVEYAREVYEMGELKYNSKGENSRIKKIVSFAGKNKKILDIGCYDGTLGLFLIKEGNEVYGIEGNENAAGEARKKGVRVTIQDVESDFGFQDDFFDLVIAGEIIEHILDTDFFLDQIKKVLKPGGILILSTPNAASLGRRFLLLAGKNPFFEASYGFPGYAHAGHIRFFTKGLLVDFLQYKKFTPLEFTSDVINLNSSGKFSSRWAAELFPTFGRSLIVKAKVNK